MDKRKRRAAMMMGGGAIQFPFSQDFSANASLAGWTVPGTAAVVGGALVITPTEGAELLTDTGMETWADANNLTNWTRGLSGSTTLNREESVIHGGSYAARFDVDATNGQGRIFRTITAAAHEWVVARAWMRASAANKQPVITLGAANLLIPNPGTTYTQYTAAGRVAAANPTVYFGRYSANSASVYVDDVSTKLLTFNTLFIYRKIGTKASYRILVDPATINVGTPFGCALLVDDPTSPKNMLSATHDANNNLKLTQRLNGAASDLLALNVAYNAASKLEIRVSNGTGQLFYGGVQQGADQAIDASLLNNQYAAIFSTSALNSIATVEIVANP